MCRFLAYQGAPVLLDSVVTQPCHSLIHQSLHAEEAKVPTNGDGFGLGWYGEREEPGLYRELRPAWSDENLLSLCRQVRSPLFFAHVRAATGTATTRANCHPFAHGRWMFMHNGQIGDFSAVRRPLEAELSDAHYAARAGTTDSELVFLLIQARLEAGQAPLPATRAVLALVRAAMAKACAREPLRFTAALTDGRTIWAFRTASDVHPPTLYLCERPGASILASEPVDGLRDCWRSVPRNTAVILSGGGVRYEPFEEGLVAA